MKHEGRPTRYNELGYAKWDRFWFIVDLSTEQKIGHNYPTKAELLADLDRVASDFGATLKGS